MTETGEAADAEAKTERLEAAHKLFLEELQFPSLQDAQVEATIADATFRQKRDALVATWRDWLHSYLKMINGDPRIIHRIIDSMDDFLNHRSRK